MEWIRRLCDATEQLQTIDNLPPLVEYSCLVKYASIQEMKAYWDIGGIHGTQGIQEDACGVV